MAERLTKKDKPIIKNQLEDNMSINESTAIKRLWKYENVMEKYHCNDIEDLQKELSMNKLLHETIAELSKMVTKAENEKYTWKMACELACEKIVDILGDCPVSNEDWQQNDDWCEEHCGENEKLLCWDRYFYQQAKKEGEQKR